jgi:hypothetical protein
VVSARKALQVFGKVPRQAIVRADDAVRGDGGDQLDVQGVEPAVATLVFAAEFSTVRGGSNRGGVIIAANYSGGDRVLPRSFLKFILLGFLLVSLPLLYALGELILSLEQLQTQGREAVQQAAQAGRTSRQLFEQAVTLERIVRQHLILDDSALIDDYDRLRQEFRRRRISSRCFRSATSRSRARCADDSESRLHKLLVMPQRSADTQAQLADGYARLADRTQAMLGVSNQLTETPSSACRRSRRRDGRSGCISRSPRPPSRSRSASSSRC